VGLDALPRLLTLILAGYSIVAAALFLLAYLFFLDEMQKSVAGKLLGAVLLGTLAGLQVFHLGYLQSGGDLFTSPVYILLLFLAPPSFFLFSQAVLLPDLRFGPKTVLHLLPLPLAFALPGHLAGMAALIIGSGYSLWLARFVSGMRRQAQRFPYEMFFFGFFALLSIFALLVGSYTAYSGNPLFFLAYANLIGIAMVLVMGALLMFPELLGDMSAAARLSYASSTLGNVDVDAKIAEIERLMLDDKVYQNEALNLQMLAGLADLSTHQLSELINSRFGMGFSRYVRGHRVAEAKRLLAADSRSSILAISMMTGFRSQSTFYAAFQEIEGEAPGHYRRKQGA
jgi:AraC-like DNA-binding protein